MSGAKDDRPRLAALMDYVREGDTVVVWKLDRLGRNMLHILQTVKALTEHDVTLVSTSDSINSSTAAGRMVIWRAGEHGRVRARAGEGTDCPSASAGELADGEALTGLAQEPVGVLLRCCDLASSSTAAYWGGRSWSWSRTPDIRRARNWDIDVEVDIDIRDPHRQPWIDVHGRRWRIFACNRIEVPVHARRARRRWWWLGLADRW